MNQKQMEGLLNLSVTLPIFLLMDVRRSSRRRDTDVCHSENLCPIPDLIGFEYKKKLLNIKLRHSWTPHLRFQS